MLENQNSALLDFIFVYTLTSYVTSTSLSFWKREYKRKEKKETTVYLHS